MSPLFLVLFFFLFGWIVMVRKLSTNSTKWNEEKAQETKRNEERREKNQKERGVRFLPSFFWPFSFSPHFPVNRCEDMMNEKRMWMKWREVSEVHALFFSFSFSSFILVIFWVVLLLCFICFNWMRALHLPFNYNKGTNKEHKTNQLFTFIIFLPFLFGLFTMDEGRRKREISQRKRERRNERKWLVCSFFSFTCSIPFLFFCFGSFRASITKEQSKRNKRNEKKVNKKKGTTTNQELGE